MHGCPQDQFSPLHVGKQPAREPGDPKMAKQIGLTIPPSLLNRAGELIKWPVALLVVTALNRRIELNSPTT